MLQKKLNKPNPVEVQINHELMLQDKFKPVDILVYSGVLPLPQGAILSYNPYHKVNIISSELVSKVLDMHPYVLDTETADRIEKLILGEKIIGYVVLCWHFESDKTKTRHIRRFYVTATENPSYDVVIRIKETQSAQSAWMKTRDIVALQTQ